MISQFADVIEDDYEGEEYLDEEEGASEVHVSPKSCSSWFSFPSRESQTSITHSRILGVD